MKTFSKFLVEAKSKTIIHKLDWDDADQFTGGEMSFKKKMRIAAQYSKRIGQGSARDVFEVDYEKKPTVMKIAKNEKGYILCSLFYQLYKYKLFFKIRNCYIDYIHHFLSKMEG